MQLNNILSKISALLSTACLCLFFVACSSDQTTTDGNIVGTVTNSRTNEPLQGVLVTLSNMGKSVTTGKDGRYQFMNLTSQDYMVQVSKENYKTDSKQVFVRAGEDNTLDFSMQPSIPEMELLQTHLDFGSDKTNLSITIKNKGYAVLNWQIVEDIEWLSCNPSKGTVSVGEMVSVVITVDRTSLTKGEYKQSIVISSNGGDASIDVNMIVQGEVEVSPEQLDFGTTTTSLDLTMKNLTKGTLTYSLSPSNAWIIPNKTSGTFSNNEIVTVGVDRTKLAAGDYSGKISLKVGNQNLDIPVRMTIIAATLPTVAIYSTDDITYNSAKLRGAVIAVGNSKVIHHGFCWSTNPNPEITLDTKCNLGDCTAAKDFSYTVSSLQPNVKYYVRAYAENSTGVAYSEEISFTTPEKQGTTTDDLYMYLWPDTPQSYIKKFDYRMDLQLLSVMRNGSNLQIEYLLKNIGFGREVRLSFAFNRTGAAYDDLGFAYNYHGFASGGHGIVTATLGGTQLGVSSTPIISFMPNQATRGTISIQGFDSNATTVSFSAKVTLVSPNDISLGYESMDFVNIPVK